MKILFFVAFFLMSLAQTALANEWGACPEDDTRRCLYTGSAPVSIVAQVPQQAVLTQINPWPWISILGLAALVLVAVWWYRRCARVAYEVEEARLAQERRRARERLEDELVAAQLAYDRGPSDRTEDRLMRAQTALHRFNHPEQPVVEGGRIVIHAADGHGEVPGAPFLGGPFVVLPRAAPAAP